MIIKFETQSHRDHRDWPLKLCVLCASVFPITTLLPKLLSGELRVPEADKMLEEVL